MVSYDILISTNFLCAMSDFHLLLFMYTTDVVQLQVGRYSYANFRNYLVCSHS